MQEFEGEDIPLKRLALTFNHYFLNHILREKLGFKGYINSDSGIVNNMSWGVEKLSEAERFAKAINAGTDLVADTNDIENLKIAIEKDGLVKSVLMKRMYASYRNVYIRTIR